MDFFFSRLASANIPQKNFSHKSFIVEKSLELIRTTSSKEDKKIRNLISLMALIIFFGMVIVFLCFIKWTMYPPMEETSPNIWDVPVMHRGHLS